MNYETFYGDYTDLLANKVTIFQSHNTFKKNYYYPLRKRQREEEIETHEKAKRDREWQKNFEVSL